MEQLELREHEVVSDLYYDEKVVQDEKISKEHYDQHCHIENIVLVFGVAEAQVCIAQKE